MSSQPGKLTIVCNIDPLVEPTIEHLHANGTHESLSIF